jgi:hypothetical protein
VDVECSCLVMTDEVLLSGDAEARFVIVLAQWSRGVEREYREIARMRQRMDVSIPMRACCIGDGCPGCQSCFYMLCEAFCRLDGSAIIIFLLLYTALIPLCLQRCSACCLRASGAWECVQSVQQV